LFLVSCFVFFGAASVFAAYPVAFTDSAGAQVVAPKRPERVVSLVPGVTEMLFALGAGDAVAGVTWHDRIPQEAGEKAIVGGFASPSLKRIEALQPDVIFLSPLHKQVRERFAGKPCLLVDLETRSIEDVYVTIALLGAIFDRAKEAGELVRRIEGELELVSRKVENIPEERRLRVMRLMGRDKLMAPGDDSFQNEFIRAAGGIPPQWGKEGSVVDISLEEWKRFNPQVVYGCGDDRKLVDGMLSRDGWKDVDAVRDGKVYYFPCELTCRASSHTGYFVEWLASMLYENEFASPGGLVLKEGLVASKPVDLPLSFVKSARVDEANVFDFPNKALVIDFRKPGRILSTLEGERTGITTVGNIGSPPPCWGVSHRLGLDASRKRVYKALGKSARNSSFLFTGANMDNLSVRSASFREMTVYALVTAGVEGNAVRMSKDEGLYYEPGTINIILLSNMRLSPRAMTRAVISATEAKTAALQDIDARSGGSPLRWQATGTGTDEIVVVEGEGKLLDNSGGHSKLGELIARTVYDGVREAIARQNCMTGNRSVLRRLHERGVSPYDLLRVCPCLVDQGEGDGLAALQGLEGIFLEPRYAAFVESALAIGDAEERGQVVNLDAFELWSHKIAEEIAGAPISQWQEMEQDKNVPPALRMALDAVLNGLSHRLKETAP
jgi:ABC-type Fe3+-hydroxamate transport system substrate-binding protein/adenosylcobinamide amidohydrolase